MKSNPRSTIVLRIIVLIGFIIFLVIFLNRTFTFTVLNSPKWAQVTYALVIALICFFASYISNRKEYKKHARLTGMISLLPWYGLILIGIAIYLISANFETRNARIGIFINYSLSGLAFLSACYIIFTYIYPQAINDEQITPPDPLSDLPKNLQKLINEGKDTIAKATINVVAIGASAVMISVFFLGNTKFPLTVLGIEALAVMIIVIIARYFAAQKWQRQAMQSGIPEKKLKSAMKLAGLSWINIKKE